MYAHAREIARLVASQFAAVRGAGAGIAGQSCCAGVAIVPNPPAWPADFNAMGAALPYAVVYGNSRMLAGGLVAGVAGGHAERAALTAAHNEGQVLYRTAANQAVLYVELLPCIAGHNCHAWLGLGGAAPQYPQAGAFPGVAVTLNVWYGHPNAAAMGVDHALALPAQLGNIAAW